MRTMKSIARVKLLVLGVLSIVAIVLVLKMTAGKKLLTVIPRQPVMAPIQPRQIHSGDEYLVSWELVGDPAKSPFYDVHFYEVQVGLDQAFTQIVNTKLVLGMSTTLMAPPLTGEMAAHLRVRGGRMPTNYPPVTSVQDLSRKNAQGKTFYESALWSQYSNIQSVQITTLPPPTLTVSPSQAYPGQTYSVMWKFALKPQWQYELQQNQNAVTTSANSPFDPKKENLIVTLDPKTLTASEERKYRVRVVTHTQAPVTKWSNEELVKVNYVNPPLLDIPVTVSSESPYEVSWETDSTYPISLDYTFDLEENGKLVSLTKQDINKKSVQRTMIASTPLTVSYIIKAKLVQTQKALTRTSSVKTVQIKPLPPQKPEITKIAPSGAARGKKVALSGNNLNQVTEVKLVHTTKSSLAVVVPNKLWSYDSLSKRIELTVPPNASLRTTHVRVIVGSGVSAVSDKEEFRVFREVGNFQTLAPYPHAEKGKTISVQRAVDGVTITAETKGYAKPSTSPVVLFNGTFTKTGKSPVLARTGAEVLGFSPFDKLGIGGVSLSPEGEAGVLLWDSCKTSGGTIVEKLVGMNFIALAYGQEANASYGKPILGNPLLIPPHYDINTGNSIFFSPDGTIVAIVGRDGQLSQKYKYHVIDLLTGDTIKNNIVISVMPKSSDFVITSDNKLKAIGSLKAITLPFPP